MASLTVIGYGETTSKAYQDALCIRTHLTYGDRRDWVVSDQSYRVETDGNAQLVVVCELTLELIETMAND